MLVSFLLYSPLIPRAPAAFFYGDDLVISLTRYRPRYTGILPETCQFLRLYPPCRQLLVDFNFGLRVNRALASTRPTLFGVGVGILARVSLSALVLSLRHKRRSVVLIAPLSLCPEDFGLEF